MLVPAPEHSDAPEEFVEPVGVMLCNASAHLAPVLQSRPLAPWNAAMQNCSHDGVLVPARFRVIR